MQLHKVNHFHSKIMKKINSIKQLTYGFLAISCVVLLPGCSTKQYVNTKVNTSYVPVNETVKQNDEIVHFLNPFRNHIDSDLSKVLAYNPEDLDRTISKWQNKMTNFYADAIIEEGNPIFEKRTGKKIDFCLLNYGGIRSTIAKGPITTRTAFNIMPFENSAVVAALKGSTVYELAQFIIDNKTAHPLSGIEIFVAKDGTIKDIKTSGQSIDKNKTYNVITNDYLVKGGDRMSFFLKATETHVLDYKLRNMFIAYFTKIDTLKPSTTPRIIFE